jgi:predicted transglutaminase-like cysteine proteinase
MISRKLGDGWMLGGLTRTLFVSIAALAFCFAPVSMHGPAQADEMHAPSAPVGAVTAMPYGWADFCGRHADECRVEALEPVDVVLTPRVMRMLRRINSTVNAAIEPVSNLDHWGTLLDHWDYPTDGKGDCKIYALQKRKMLLEMGFPRQALLMTIVRDQEDNGHTILTVKTDKGDLILDNMVEDIRAWDRTGYKFVKRQSQNDPNVWVSIGTSSAPGTTAAAVTSSRMVN